MPPTLLPADWQRELKSYVARHPSTRLLDSFEAIEVLGNRDRMLRALDGGLRLKAPGAAEGQELMCRVPVQVTIDTGAWPSCGCMYAAGLQAEQTLCQAAAGSRAEQMLCQMAVGAP